MGGATPANDEEAIERILDAASAAISVRGATIRVVDVARSLEISRQTVYNYFPGNSLLEALANRSGLRFIQRLVSHLAGHTDPIEALVEKLCLHPGVASQRSARAVDVGERSGQDVRRSDLRHGQTVRTQHFGQLGRPAMPCR